MSVADIIPTPTAAAPAQPAPIPTRTFAGSSVPTKSPGRPLGKRINLRMIAFGIVVLTVVGYPVYVYVNSVVTGGIEDLGGGVKQVDLKAMSSYPLDQTNGTASEIPPQWRELDGKNVVLYGEIWDAHSAGSSDIKSFELCYSIAKCCFSGPPQVQHFVQSVVLPGKSVNFYPNLVRVSGKLHVNVIHDAGKISSVYQMDVSDIQPAA